MEDKRSDCKHKTLKRNFHKKTIDYSKVMHLRGAIHILIFKKFTTGIQSNTTKEAM